MLYYVYVLLQVTLKSAIWMRIADLSHSSIEYALVPVRCSPQLSYSSSVHKPSGRKSDRRLKTTRAALPLFQIWAVNRFDLRCLIFLF